MRAELRLNHLQTTAQPGLSPQERELLTTLLSAMGLVILLSHSVTAPRPWVERAKEIVREFEK